MASDQFASSVLLLVFNRPDTTARVFEAIRSRRPRSLYVAADGPRDSHPDDVLKCAATRAVIENVDWPCEVHRLFRESNLGCRVAVSSAIDWFFEHVERGLILEDDCLPVPEFFEICEELLAYYENDTRVMHIAGMNLNGVVDAEGASYTFSKYTPIWGWATWRRAWKYYDVNMTMLDQFTKRGGIRRAFVGWQERINRQLLYDLVYQRKIDTWDYQWNFAVVANEGLSVIPAKSRVANIGFDGDATHTINARGIPGLAVDSKPLLPLRHPRSVGVNRQHDRVYFNDVTKRFSPTARLLVKRYLPERVYSSLKRWLSR